MAFWSRYRKFPQFSLPSGVINTAGAQLPLVIIGARFGADVAGFIALAFRTLAAPISLLGTALLDVFKRQASTSWRETGHCRGVYVQTFWVLAVASMAAATTFFWLGPDLFALVFGERWRPAGEAASILIPLFAARFVASPLSYTFFLAEKQDFELAWQIVLFMTTLTTLLALPGYDGTLIAYAAGYTMLYLVYVAMSYRFSGGSGR